MKDQSVIIETPSVSFTVEIRILLIDTLQEWMYAVINEYLVETDEGAGLTEEEAEVVEREIRNSESIKAQYFAWKMASSQKWDFYTEDSTEGEEGLEGTEEEVKFDIMTHHEISEWPEGWHLVPAGEGR